MKITNIKFEIFVYILLLLFFGMFIIMNFLNLNYNIENMSDMNNMSDMSDMSDMNPTSLNIAVQHIN
jgi:hypothetical protein